MCKKILVLLSFFVGISLKAAKSESFDPVQDSCKVIGADLKKITKKLSDSDKEVVYGLLDKLGGVQRAYGELKAKFDASQSDSKAKESVTKDDVKLSGAPVVSGSVINKDLVAPVLDSKPVVPLIETPASTLAVPPVMPLPLAPVPAPVQAPVPVLVAASSVSVPVIPASQVPLVADKISDPVVPALPIVPVVMPAAAPVVASEILPVQVPAAALSSGSSSVGSLPPLPDLPPLPPLPSL
jgi:hypothetical protein